MSIILSLGRIAVRMPGYFAYRMGWRREFDFLDILPSYMDVTVLLGRWKRRLRVIQPDTFPDGYPCVFAGNHAKKTDPFIVFYAVYRASRGRTEIRHMMRDDFFAAGPRIPLIDLDEFLCMVGALQISRDMPTIGQLKPFVQLLRGGLSFEMYPGRSRSRSGLLLEYREGIEEPGSVSFFLAQAQRKHPDLKVAAVAFARSFNPVTKHSTIAFGEPCFLETDAGREAQRAFDFDLIRRMGELVELHVPHALSLILYLRCLHGMPGTLEQDDVCERVLTLFRAVAAHRLVDPQAVPEMAGQVGRALPFFVKTRHGADPWRSG
jgi:hypothetical protein